MDRAATSVAARDYAGAADELARRTLAANALRLAARRGEDAEAERVAAEEAEREAWWAADAAKSALALAAHREFGMLPPSDADSTTSRALRAHQRLIALERAQRDEQRQCECGDCSGARSAGMTAPHGSAADFFAEEDAGVDGEP